MTKKVTPKNKIVTLKNKKTGKPVKLNKTTGRFVKE
jgi:hypothetical protein